MKRIIGVNEAAEILRISRLTLMKRLQDGTINIPYSHIGRVYKFKEEDVENYFNNSFKSSLDHKNKEED